MAPPDANRDRGLRRISRTTRWFAGGAVALMGVVSAVAAYAAPGRSTGTSSTTPTSGATTPSNQSTPTTQAPDTSSQSSGGFQAPSQAPTRTHHSPSVQSGGT
jgi:hypothetical protein